MQSGGNSFNYFLENLLTKLVHLVQFKRVFMSCLGDGGGWASCWVPPLATPLEPFCLQLAKLSGAKRGHNMGWGGEAIVVF